MSKQIKYQNPSFDKDNYWKLKGKKKPRVESKVITPGALLSIEGDKIVVKNRAQIRKERRGRKYSFYHRKGYIDSLGAIKIKRVKNGMPKYKLVPVTIDQP